MGIRPYVGKSKTGSSGSGPKRRIPRELKPLNGYSRNPESPKYSRVLLGAPVERISGPPSAPRASD